MKWESVVGGNRDLNYVTLPKFILKKLATFAQILETCLVQKPSRTRVGYTLVTLPRIVTPYSDSVDGTRDRVTYQKLVTR